MSRVSSARRLVPPRAHSSNLWFPPPHCHLFPGTSIAAPPTNVAWLPPHRYRCTFVDAAVIIQGGAALEAAETKLHELIGKLTRQRDEDAGYVNRALPQLLNKAHALPPPPPNASEEQCRARELFVLGQVIAY